MDLSDIWDWDFFWSMFRNFTATGAPFVMIVVVVAVVGMLLGTIVSIVRSKKT